MEIPQVPRDVILDLVPLYLAGEASPATQALVEEYLKQDPALDRKVRSEWAAGIGRAAPAALPPEIELRSLRRTRAVLALQRWLFGFGIFFLVSTFSLEVEFSGPRPVRLLMLDYPALCGLSFAISAVLFAVYFILRWKMRANGNATSPQNWSGR